MGARKAYRSARSQPGSTEFVDRRSGVERIHPAVVGERVADAGITRPAHYLVGDHRAVLLLADLAVADGNGHPGRGQPDMAAVDENSGGAAPGSGPGRTGDGSGHDGD